MRCFSLSQKNKRSVLALGAESAGNFSVYNKEKIYFSEDFGDLLEEVNWEKYNRALGNFLKQQKIKPEIILTDLHPLYKTTALGEELAKKYSAKHIQVQHHLAHIFSAIGEELISNLKFKISNSFVGIALDGTGYGLDNNIWGGEVFEVKSEKHETKSIKRIGKLENQIMIGGDLTVKEPARMLIGILAKITKHKKQKDFIYRYIKKFYPRNQFEVLFNQLKSGFNCQETSSTGRVLDAVSVLLGFSGNQRNYKHEPAILLEKNSTVPYHDLKPKIKKGDVYELDTTYLFKYLFKYLHRDKRRLAATAQLYIAQGLHKIIKIHNTSYKIHSTYIAGGIANNKIISEYLISKDAIVNTRIPRGDAGISLGQIVYFLTNPRH